MTFFKFLQEQYGMGLDVSDRSLRKVLKSMGCNGRKQSATVTLRSTCRLLKKIMKSENWLTNYFTYEPYTGLQIFPIRVKSVALSNSFLNCMEHAFLFHMKPASSNYHEEMNTGNYEKWLKIKRIPNLPLRLVIEACTTKKLHTLPDTTTT